MIFTGKSLLCSVALLTCCSLWADDQMVVVSTTDAQQAIDLSKLSKITFDADNMSVETTDGVTNFLLDEISQIRFDLDISAVTDLLADLGEINIAVNGGVVTASASDGAQLNVALYNIKGAVLNHFTASGEAQIDLNQLPTGVYILKVNNKVIKIQR